MELIENIELELGRKENNDFDDDGPIEEEK